jgi:periplasmic protein TonB
LIFFNTLNLEIMESKYLKAQLDDIIFESRNKSYGAYALRQSYGKRMKRGTIIGLSLFALLISSPLIADRLDIKKEALDNRVIEMSDKLPEDIKKPDIPPPTPPPPPPPVKQPATVRFEPPVVTEEAETEPPMPRIEDISVNVSTQTKEGEHSEVFVNKTDAPVPPPIDVPKSAVEEKKETIFLIVEQQPEFGNGVKDLFRFLSENIKYPPVARENGIEETVYVGFVVWNDGSIRNVEVKRGRNASLNEEAVRVISMMPKWKAGRQNGKSVNVAFTVPIKFHLE